MKDIDREITPQDHLKTILLTILHVYSIHINQLVIDTKGALRRRGSHVRIVLGAPKLYPAITPGPHQPPHHQRLPDFKNFKVPYAQPLQPTYLGRRDWTRTNDPHHVKVVL